ncbi:RDD family protein [Nocardioides ungokensis]|uniref:RDD family protein n=1 Tax=Nocardioides ungokensis TaxID=1643322 RepID=UPI0015DE2FE2|nr:RDD family protein [Nocardioides ungokensis]
MTNEGTTPHRTSPPDPFPRERLSSDPYGLPPREPNPYASWFKRVVAFLIDGLLVTVAYFPAFIGAIVSASGGSNAASTTLVVIGALLALAVFVWNTCLRAGRTGYSIGKGVLGIKLVGDDSGTTIGPGRAFVRYLLHIVDVLPLYLGYLWPLWDPKRQTFSDKLMHTVVRNEPQ